MIFTTNGILVLEYSTGNKVGHRAHALKRLRALFYVLTNKEIAMTDKEKLDKALDLLNELFQQADEDCPQENRSRHFVDTFEETEEFLVEMGLRKYE